MRPGSNVDEGLAEKKPKVIRGMIQLLLNVVQLDQMSCMYVPRGAECRGWREGSPSIEGWCRVVKVKGFEGHVS